MIIRTSRKKPHAHRERRKQFLSAWLRSPLKMGAVVPSSKSLARAMAAQVDGKAEGVVIELGAGTGVMTHALLQGGVAPQRLVVVERDTAMHATLSAQYSDSHVVCADAAELDRVIKKIGIAQVAAIVSSLPLLSIPKHIRDIIVGHMAAAIDGEGVIVQFTYGPRSPIPQRLLKEHGLLGRRVKTILRNVPPAHVWVYRKSVGG